MTKNIGKYFKVVFIILFYFLSTTLLAYLLKYFNIDIKSFSKFDYIVFSIGADILLILILCLIYRKDLKENFINFKNKFSNYFAFGFKWWLFGLTIMIISNLIINYYFPGEATNELLIESSIKIAPIYMIISVVMCGPFIEEMIFRKSIREIFTNDMLYILVCGLFFGFVHTLAGSSSTELIYIIPYGALGAVFAYMYAKTDNIFVPTTFHIIHNGILSALYIISIFSGVSI